MATTSADIKIALMAHYPAPGWRVFFEVAADTGVRANRHIDALACGIWPSVGHEVHGIEIKVSRSDWKRELADPAKAQELMRFSNRWWLACPDGLVAPDEVPATWGVLYLKENGAIKVKKQAPALTPDPITRGFMMAVIRNAPSVDAELIAAIATKNEERRQDEYEKRLEQAVDQRVRSNAQRTEDAIKIAETVLALTGQDIREYSGVDPKAFVATYLLLRDSGLLQHIGQGWGGLASLHSNLTQAIDTITKLHGHPGIEEIRNLVNPPRKSR